MWRGGRGSAEVMPLRDYVDHIYAELQSEMDRRVHSVEAAASAAAVSITQRLDGMNELRGAMSDMSGKMTARDAFDTHVAYDAAQFSSMDGRVTALEAAARTEAALRGDTRQAAGTRLAYASVAIAALAIVVTVIVNLYLHKLRAPGGLTGQACL